MLSKEDKRHIASMIAETIFCCYEGDRISEEIQLLIKNPEKIEEVDYRKIALPWDDVVYAKFLIDNLVGDEKE